jgi:hypothetical protein
MDQRPEPEGSLLRPGAHVIEIEYRESDVEILASFFAETVVLAVVVDSGSCCRRWSKLHLAAAFTESFPEY